MTPLPQLNSKKPLIETTRIKFPGNFLITPGVAALTGNLFTPGYLFGAIIADHQRGARIEKLRRIAPLASHQTFGARSILPVRIAETWSKRSVSISAASAAG
jgi:hypothetical protein